MRARSLLMTGFALLSLIIIPLHVRAQENTNTALFPEVTVQTTSAAEDEEDDGMTFLSGEEVNTSKAASSDVYAAGYSVIIDEPVGGDVFAAGNQIVVEGIVKGDLRIAGNSIVINSIVHGNAMIFANSVVIGDQASIAGHVTIFASQTTINGIIEKTVKIAGSHVTINGVLKGKTNINAELVSFSAGANLGNDTTVTSPTTPLLDGQASGTDKITYTKRESHTEKSRGLASQSEFLSWFLSFIFFGIIGSLALSFQPKWFGEIAATMEKHNALSWWKGFLFFFSVPLVALLVACTLIGIPFAVLGMILYCASLLLGQLCVGFLIGRHVIHKQRRQPKRSHTIFTFIIGYFILSVIISLPWIGGLMMILASMWGIGGILQWRHLARSKEA